MLDLPYFDEFGVKFSEDRKTLISCPRLYEGEYVIPTGVTRIEDHAFFACFKMTSVTIPNSVTSIGNGIFRFCHRLTSVKVQEGNTIYDSRDNCNAIIETASNKLIAGCRNTIIPDSVTSIGDWAFAQCREMPYVTIPNGITSIGEVAFFECGSLTSIDVSPNNPSYCSIDGVLFNKDKTLLIQCPPKKQGQYTIPNSVTSIGAGAFHGSNLTSIDIPDSVTNIGFSAFQECNGLTSVFIPDSVTSIGRWAFYQCKNLITVTIPDRVSSIGDCAFYGCYSLTSIDVSPNNPSYCSIDGVA